MTIRPIEHREDTTTVNDARVQPAGALGRVLKLSPGPRRLPRTLAALEARPQTTRYEDAPPPCDRTRQTPRPYPTLLLTHGLGSQVAKPLVPAAIGRTQCLSLSDPSPRPSRCRQPSSANPRSCPSCLRVRCCGLLRPGRPSP